MRFIGILFSLILSTAGLSQSTIFPANYDTLSFTGVMFSFPDIEFENLFIIEIENKTDNRSVTLYSAANKMYVNTLEFDKDYRWRYAATSDQARAKDWSPYYSFSTRIPAKLRNQQLHFSVNRKSRSKTEASVYLLDYAQCGVNRMGKTSFYVPHLEGISPITQIRDLELTPQGTFTAIADSVPCEFDKLGNVLWRAPDNGVMSGELSENYHHEFTKLPNGNYLILGTDNEVVQLNGKEYKVGFDTVLEFDEKGKLGWSWNSRAYFDDEFLIFLAENNPLKTDFIRLHANACSTDGENVYVGFRDISRIVVVNKRSKKVVSSYGGYGPSREPNGATNFFRRQHDVELLKDGNIAVVNNDSVMDPSVVSSLVIFSKIDKHNPISEKRLDFKFDFDSLTNGKSPKTGNLQELSNGNLFVNMGSIPRCFELTRDGELVWDFIIHRFDSVSKSLVPFPQYRVHSYSTLYPYEFAARLLELKSKKEKQQCGVKIFNVGSEEDIYSIFLVDARDRRKFYDTVSLKAGSSELISIPVDLEFVKGIFIESQTTSKQELVSLPFINR